MRKYGGFQACIAEVRAASIGAIPKTYSVAIRPYEACCRKATIDKPRHFQVGIPEVCGANIATILEIDAAAICPNEAGRRRCCN